MTLYKTIVLALLTAPCLACVPPHTYQGKPINKDTILSMVPAVPKELELKLQLRLVQKPTLVEVLSGSSYAQLMPGSDHAPFSMKLKLDLMTPQDRVYLETLRSNLAHAGITVPAGNAGIIHMLQNFNVDLDEWIIKASGFLNRRANILHEMGLNNRDVELPHAKLIEFMVNHGGHTYQTISRTVSWLRAKEAQEKLSLTRICIPEEYLVHIPGRPTELDDTNYVVASRKVPGTVAITQTDLLLDEELVKQLAQAIFYSSLWDINGGNILAAGDKACIVDFEQPNAFKPSEFGRGGMGGSGLDGLKTMIKDYGKDKNKDVTRSLEIVNNVLTCAQ